MCDNIEMNSLKTAERWWTYPAQAENGKTVLVTGRDNLYKQMHSGKFTSRIDVTWQYDALPDGMPSEADAKLMGEATDAMLSMLRKDKCAVMTGIYTGDGKRDWVFYCRNLKAFSIIFNKALEQLDTMPLEIEALDDPQWEEYMEMRRQTYVPQEDED